MTMAPDTALEWNPTTEADKKLKESLELLVSSTDSVMLTGASQVANSLQDEQEKKLLLQSKAYFGEPISKPKMIRQD